MHEAKIGKIVSFTPQRCKRVAISSNPGCRCYVNSRVVVGGKSLERWAATSSPIRARSRPTRFKFGSPFRLGRFLASQMQIPTCRPGIFEVSIF